MNPPSVFSILRNALVAGLLAGLITAAFHFAFTETVIEQAIALEQAHTAEHGTAESAPPVVSREGQRLGLFLGYGIYGLMWGLLFGVVFATLRLARRSGAGAGPSGWWLALLAGWSVGVLPFLKYPANPPGVGDPDTISYRLGLYAALLALSVIGTAAAAYAGHRMAPGGNGRALSAALAILWGAILVLAMPANPDAVSAPEALLQSFRALSLAGLALFWISFAIGFGWLTDPKRARPSLLAPGTS
ncbi:MAG: hypothetical protein EXR51_06300 [Dehalococcoidia bacterium]|nr:hypothetical protein [Dehalococcoidia bacterium]